MSRNFQDDERESEWQVLKRWIIRGSLAAFAVILLATMWGSSYTIDEKERGVLLRNGAFVEVVHPGWRLKWPFIETVLEFDLDDRKLERQKEEAFTFDQQAARVNVSITYRANQTNDGIYELYFRHGGLKGYESQIVEPLLLKAMKEVFGRYTAERAIRQRTLLNAEIETAVIDAINKSSPAGKAVRVQVTDISWSKEYINSIEQRAVAEIQVLQQKQVEEREKIQANIAVIQAKGRADSAFAEAEAQAKAIRIKGEAEADAIKARANALGQNPLLVLLTQAEKWNGELPSTMVPNGALPMLNLNPPAEFPRR